MSLAFFMSACGDDNSSGASVDCLENESCLDDDLSSAFDDESSSSVKGKSSSSSKAKSSSSVKKDEKSSSSEKDAKSSSSKKDEKSSSSAKKDDKSSSSTKDDKSSSSEKVESSSSEAESSSSEEPESSSSVELKVTFLSETPNAADLEVSGDTLFAVFQRYVPVTGGADFQDPGLLAMYKLSDGTLLDTIPLLTKNPMAVTWGIDADDNRGIEKIDLKNKKSELWVSGAELGGGVNLMEVNAKEGKAYVAVYRAYGDVFVVEVDLASKSVKSVGKEVDATGGLFFDADKNLLYIGDRGVVNWTTLDASDMGVRAYDGTTFTSLTSEEPYEFLYQPYSIAVAGGELFVYVSDYSSGALYWFEEGEFNDEDRIQFSADAVIRNVNGKLIVLDRGDKGSIAEVNTSAKTVAWQAALNKDNPYDIVAIDNNTAWVAMYDVGEIRKISLGDGSTISSIDTKEFSAKKVEVVE